MRNIYLYGASDDCMEVETDIPGTRGTGGPYDAYESYEGIQLGPVRVHYVFDGDWGIWLEGDVPATWKVRSIEANYASDVRGKPHAGQFIHIQIPDDEPIEIKELDASDDD